MLDAHELEELKRGASFRWYGQCSAATFIGSETSRGHLVSYIDDRTGQIVHAWTYDN